MIASSPFLPPSRPLREGWGRVFFYPLLSSFEQDQPQRLHHAVEVLDHIDIPEPQHMITRRFQKRGPVGVRVHIMLAAVQFDDQLGLDAEEIHHIAADRRLAAELGGFELAVAQRVPEAAFDVRRVPAQAGGLGADLAADGGHGFL